LFRRVGVMLNCSAALAIQPRAISDARRQGRHDAINQSPHGHQWAVRADQQILARAVPQRGIGLLVRRLSMPANKK
jgi:hypothetical protein